MTGAPGAIERAAEAIAGAKALLFTAGAGMGVDSGLPDFRGDEGFWKAYPPFRECHGSIHHLQCLRGCGVGIFPAEATVSIDETTFRARPPLPACPRCGSLARPNVLMFGDGGWDDARSAEQTRRFGRFVNEAPAGTCVVECGAGRAVPTVRYTSERAAARFRGTLVRINVREPDTPPGHVGLKVGALEALTRIEALLAP